MSSLKYFFTLIFSFLIIYFILAWIIHNKMAIKIKNKNKKKVSIIILEKILHNIEKKLIIKTSPFLYE